MKRISDGNGTAIAIRRVPVMYRLLEKSRPARKNSRHSARAATKVVANRLREPVAGAVEITIAHNLLGGQ